MLKTVDLIDEEASSTTKPKKSQIDLGKIIKTLKNTGSAEGFRDLRDLILQQIHDKDALVELLELAMKCDKHATFSDIAQTKVKDNKGVLRWDMFQGWLSEGKSLPTEEELDEEDGESLGVSEGGESS